MHPAQTVRRALALILPIVTAAFGLATTPEPAAAGRLGAGVYGMQGVPVLQDDVGSGPLYGAKVRWLLGVFGIEAFYTSFQEGDVTFDTADVQNRIRGGSQDARGVNLLFGSAGRGIRPYLTGGVASYAISKPRREDRTETGANGGAGLELGSGGPLSIDLTARLHAVLPEAGGSRKFVALQAGINYDFVR